MTMLRGIIHIHTGFSYDGKNTIPEWAAFLKAKGYNFVCLTEHDDDFDDAKMAGLVTECRQVSTDSFHIVPGLEFRCANKVHILGLGLTKFYKTNDPIVAAQFIRDNNGVSVIAHPRRYERNITEELIKTVDSIEIWNGAKDSRFFPHPEVLGLYKRCRGVNPDLIAIGGADVHGIDSYFQLDVHITDNAGTEWNIKNLKDGGLRKICGRYFSISSGKPGLPLTCLQGMRLVYDRVKTWRDRQPTGKT